jgi:hypothetical protein
MNLFKRSRLYFFFEQIGLGFEERQLVSGRDLSSVIARSSCAEYQDTRVAEPIQEQRERDSDDENAYKQSESVISYPIVLLVRRFFNSEHHVGLQMRYISRPVTTYSQTRVSTCQETSYFAV